jgi:spermidine synthase
VLLALFFLSGASALLFQTLWFRLAGLTLGNSVWASSLVLAAFMAGLALGNLGAVRLGPRLRHPLRAYAWLEWIVGGSGLAVVLLFPALTPVAARWFGALWEWPLALNALRLALAFALLLLPTTAMGATLPLVVKALTPRAHFGKALGYLYGGNTLGAMAGALAGELVLIPELGLRGTGSMAALLNVAAGAGAWLLSGRLEAAAPSAPGAKAPLPRGAVLRLLAAAVCGGCLLALEVLWFRLLQLFVTGTTVAFAIMLAVVLLGIAAGGFAAGRWLDADGRAHRFVPLLALGSALLVEAGYGALDSLVGFAEGRIPSGPLHTAFLSLGLMLPVSVVSGGLFTLLGAALKDAAGDESAVTGRLTVANTAGAMAGALLAGFLLLPGLGVERSLFVVLLAYLLVAALNAGAGGLPNRRTLLGLAAAAVLLVALFPFGRMERASLARVARRFAAGGARPVAVREGLTETILYLRRDVLGEPVSFQLLTNGFSMSIKGEVHSPRYMRAYVFWPLALHPRPRHALMISFGVGNTAQALTQSRELESIDVVDISKDVLEMSRICFVPPETHPLDDPRVRVHVEDGRFFLTATERRFDIITGEPPPPILAGIVNLYSREYFSLIHDRLAEGGITTYWLPVTQLDRPSTLAIIRGFCDVFPDCSLWSGATLNWMLVGTRQGAGPPPEARFRRLWDDPALGPSLREVGFESAEHLGATFLADAAQLQALTRDTPPLDDDHPHRLRPRVPDQAEMRFYRELTDWRGSLRRFEESAYARSAWPPAVFAGTLARFEERGLYDAHFGAPSGFGGQPLAELHAALTRTRSEWLPLVLLGSHPREQEIAARAAARGDSSSLVSYLQAVGALARRDYAAAGRALDQVIAQEPGFERAWDFRVLAACLGGGAEAGALLGDARLANRLEGPEHAFWSELKASCGQRAGP